MTHPLPDSINNWLDLVTAYYDQTDLPIINLTRGQVLLQQGDAADNLYILLAGGLGVQVTQADGKVTEIDKLYAGDVVGEMGLLAQQKRTATVYALVDSRLLEISQATFEAIRTKDPAFLDKMATALGARWQRVQLSSVLTNLLGDLDSQMLHALQTQLEWIHLSNGDVLFNEGDPADGMYIVVNGRLRISRQRPDAPEEILGESSPGETIGEFALLTAENRSATITAIRETNLLKMTPAVFSNLITQYPRLMVTLTRIIVERQLRLIGHTPSPQRVAALSMAILPTQPRLDSRPFVAQLAAALSPFGTSRVLTAAEFDTAFGRDGAAQLEMDDPINPAIVAWLSEQETLFDFLFYLPDREWTPWTQRCLSQADRVLLIADPTQTHQPGPLEQRLDEFPTQQRTELILWQATAVSRPSHTAPWLKARPHLTTHHHIRQQDKAHFGRLARHLTGKTIGLTLSGGGARGFSHMGVFKALEELNIPVDYVGGTSFGALMGAAIACGNDYATIRQQAQKLGNSKVLFDRTLPFVALNTSHKVTRALQWLYDDRQIEDLWIPYFAISADLSAAEMRVHRQGPVWLAVRQSVSIPGVFTPINDDGNIIVDGGVINNFPVDVMGDLGESDRIIGVNVSPPTIKKRDYALGEGISGWKVLASRLNPFTKPIRVPNLVGTLMRSLEINSQQRTRHNETLTDLLLQPVPHGFGLLEFDAYAAIAQIGYEESLAPLREWRDQQADLV